ncbi:MAG: hypothetical protein AABX47_02915, partial [Nanoarchaeota archaeon]
MILLVGPVNIILMSLGGSVESRAADLRPKCLLLDEPSPQSIGPLNAVIVVSYRPAGFDDVKSGFARKLVVVVEVCGSSAV